MALLETWRNLAYGDGWMIKKEKSCGPDISRSRREFMSRSFPSLSR